MKCIESFEKSFKTSRGSCRGTCECGKQFYNSNGGWSWEDGELEALEKNNEAIDLDWTVGFIRYEDVEFCIDCECWHERAKGLMEFIDSHAYQIAAYLNAEKKRKTEDAERMPTVK